MFEKHPAGGDLAIQKRMQQRQMVFTIYFLYALVPLSAGLTGLLAVAVNYIQRANVQGSFYEPHFHWQIRLFWETMVWLTLAFLTFCLAHFGLSLFFGLVGLGRFIYRLVRGLYCLNRNKLLPIEHSLTSSTTPA